MTTMQIAQLAKKQSMKRTKAGPPTQVASVFARHLTANPVWASRAPLQASLKVNAPGDRYEEEAERVADKVMRAQSPQMSRKSCTCGNPAGPDGMCAECKREQVDLQRKESGRGSQTDAPSSVPQTLQQPGQPLDASTRSFMESRLGRDFSNVRVHTDGRAGRSAQAIDARAYTVGADIVFAPDEYRPGVSSGRRLLAHELAHVIQQRQMHNSVRVQRDASHALDADARRIIALAQDSAQPIEQRGVALVRAMISHYFSGDAAKVSDVVWEASDPGLSVTYRGRGENITGIITVGRYFVEHTTNRGLARRLLQLRHEIDHVEQQRAGMRGAGRSDEREFLAFHHEALSPEIPHTGRVSHSTRVSLIDAALGYYYCFDPQVRTQHASKRRELLQRRPGEVRSSGRASQIPAAPTSCRRQ